MNLLNSIIHQLSRPAHALRCVGAAILLLLLAMPAVAKKTTVAVDTVTAAKAFLLMPQQDLDLLTKSMRQDMLDYMVERDSIYKKANIYMGLSWIEVMKPDYMRVHLSDVSSLQIKLLKQDGNPLPLVMTVYTIDDGNGTADSTVKFFNNAMQELPTAKFLALPDPKEFYNIPKDSPVSRRDIEDAMPFYTMDFTINPATGALCGRLTSADGLSHEQSERFKPYIRPELNWTWTGKKMKLINPVN